MDTYLHPDTVRENGNLACEHTSGALEGFRQVFGPDWVSRYMAPIYRLLLHDVNDAVLLEKSAGNTAITLRYTLTNDAPDIS